MELCEINDCLSANKMSLNVTKSPDVFIFKAEQYYNQNYTSILKKLNVLITKIISYFHYTTNLRDINTSVRYQSIYLKLPAYCIDYKHIVSYFNTKTSPIIYNISHFLNAKFKEKAK